MVTFRRPLKTYPTLVSVLILITCVASCPAFLCIAYNRFSSITASAKSPSLRPLTDEEDDFDECVPVSPFLRLGMTIKASWRGRLERFKTRTSQENASPTRTDFGAVKAIDTPKSVTEPARRRCSVDADSEDAPASRAYAGNMFPSAVDDVLWRLLGLFFLCID